MLTFVEDPNFTAAAAKILSAEEINDLMVLLYKTPEAGDVIRGSGGCRKLRFAAKGKGKSRGARVIYFYRMSAGEILLLAIYTKGERENLTAAEIETIKGKVK